MDEGAVGLIVFLATAIGAATAWYCFDRKFAVAAIGATITSLAIFHAFVAAFPGAPNKFYAIAVVASVVSTTAGAGVTTGAGSYT